jgi:hypothetical protein
MPGKYVAGTHSGPRARFSPPQSLGYHAEVRLLIADFWLLIEDRAPKRLRFFNQQSRINNRTPPDRLSDSTCPRRLCPRVA